jgi:homoserine kinase type II
MAVYTTVSEAQLAPLLVSLNLGQAQELTPIKGGIENTNYFLTTEKGQFVLTLFERLGFEQLPFYLNLMKHLALKGIKVPDPVLSTSGDIVFLLNEKPAAIVSRLKGQSELSPGTLHCQMVGAMLARTHLAGQDFQYEQLNLRGLDWWTKTTPQVLPHLDKERQEFLISELAFQQHAVTLSAYKALPKGPVHADLFRDNVMFEDSELSGFFDFYFAGVDRWLFDLGVCINDWCVDLDSGVLERVRFEAMLHAYQQVRPLSAAERAMFNPMLRAAALRFWISRLWDFHLPREASLLQPHDPAHFERVLEQRLYDPVTL